jgi:hypothetical protein
MKTFITLILIIVSATAISQTVYVTETFPSTEFNNSGSGGQSGNFTGDMNAWSFTSSSGSIIEVDNAPRSGKTKALRMASGSGSTNNPRINTATSPRISLSGSSCPISQYDFTFDWLVEDGAGGNYEVNLQFSGDGGSSWNTVWSNTSLPSEGNWRTVTVTDGIPDINSYQINDDFRFRFTSRRSSGSSLREIWFDNIRILASYSGTTIPTFSALPLLVQGVHLQPGAVYLYNNVVSEPEILDALIKIEVDSNAHVTLLDNNVPNPGRFQPKIANDGQLGNGSETSDRGWVQFSITFIKNNSYKEGNLLTDTDDEFVAQALSGLRYQHYDVDGFLNGSEAGGGYFRETGAISSPAGILVNTPSDITDGGVIKAAGYDWRVMKGEIAEHDGISSDLDVTFTATFGAASVIRFRLGFEFVKGSGGAVNADREYATEFNCLSYPQQATLPVRLMSFNGSYRNNATHLTWETDSEVNFDRFEVERSSNASNYAMIGTKESTSSSQSSKQTYNYNDDLSSQAGNVFYYRLKMVDKDGQYKYSNVIMIRKEATELTGIALSPNPVVNGMATVRFTSQGTSVVSMRVIDMNGKVVLQQQNRVYAGNNSVSLNNLSRLQPGTYVLQMVNEEEMSTIKFNIVR